jgi:hypothetical protein
MDFWRQVAYRFRTLGATSYGPLHHKEVWWQIGLSNQPVVLLA